MELTISSSLMLTLRLCIGTRTLAWIQRTCFLAHQTPFTTSSDSCFRLKFDFAGSLPTVGSNPVMTVVDHFNSGTINGSCSLLIRVLDTLPDLVITASDCYSMYVVLNFATADLTDIQPTFDGSCDTCGCGSSYGIIAQDIGKFHLMFLRIDGCSDQDNDIDIINFLTGGVEILLNTGGTYNSSQFRRQIFILPQNRFFYLMLTPISNVL